MASSAVGWGDDARNAEAHRVRMEERLKQEGDGEAKTSRNVETRNV